MRTGGTEGDLASHMLGFLQIIWLSPVMSATHEGRLKRVISSVLMGDSTSEAQAKSFKCEVSKSTTVFNSYH